MTDTQIPREAVDAAARALGNHINVDFDVLGPVEQLEAREAAVAALNAAAPLIVAAELEAIATRFEVNASDVAAWAEVQDDHDRLPGEGEAGAYATEAESLRKRIAELKSGVDEPAKSAEPRTWRAGDPEPVDARTVRDVRGVVWTCRSSVAFWDTPGDPQSPWAYIVRKWAPVTEVLADSEAGV